MDIKSGGAAPSMTQLLDNMRQLREQAVKNNVFPTGLDQHLGKSVSESDATDFSSMLKQAINKVNDVQSESGRLKKGYELGDPNIDITQVMVASQKATIAFEAMKQVRNKFVEAYRDVMNMPI